MLRICRRSLTIQPLVWNRFLRFRNKKTTSISSSFLSVSVWSFTIFNPATKLLSSQRAKDSRKGMLSHPNSTSGSFQASIVGVHVRRNSIKHCSRASGDFSLFGDGLLSRALGGVDGPETFLSEVSTTIGPWLMKDFETCAQKSTIFYCFREDLVIS